VAADAAFFLRGFASRARKGVPQGVLAPPPLRGGPPKNVAEATSLTLALSTPALGEAKVASADATEGQQRERKMTEKSDVYNRVTDKIIADLERGNLTWLQPWQAGHKAGPVSRPLRAGGIPY